MLSRGIHALGGVHVSRSGRGLRSMSAACRSSDRSWPCILGSRFCRRARELGLPVPSINDGVTRADDFLSVKDGRPVCGRCPDWRRRRGEEALST